MKFENRLHVPSGKKPKRVKSLTRNLDVLERGSDGAEYFVKSDPEGKQADQILALESLGLPVPEHVF